MQFANADAFLFLLLLIPLAVVKIIADGMGRRRLARVAGPRLLSSLKQGGWRGRDAFVFLLELLGLLLLVAAWARPQWGYTEREVSGQGRSIIIALDTSRSMLATDLTPDRLTRAKLAAQDLIAALPGDRIGLIAFAGRSFLQAPLTTDHDALLETLAQFDEELIPRGGSNLAEPIELAIEAFDKSGSASHALIMFTDGDETEGRAIEAAKKAKDHNIIIVAVGVGTREGTLLPDFNSRRPGGFLRDEKGRPVRSRLEDKALEGVAKETQGLYLNLSSTSVLQGRIQVILSKLDRSRTQAQKDKRQPIERYRWALVPALLCFAAAFVVKMGRRLRFWTPSMMSRPAVAWAGLVLVTGATNLSAAVAQKPRAAQNPWQLYQAQQYEESLDAFGDSIEKKPSDERLAQLEFGRAAAAYRLKDFDAAIESFGRALISKTPSNQAQAEYNLANALAGKAQSLPKGKGRITRMIDILTTAVEHYDASLALAPGNGDAQHNRDEVKKYLEELKKYREQLRQKSKAGKKNKQQGGQQGEQQPNGQQGEEGESGNSGEQGDEEGEDEGEGEEEEGEEGKGEEGQNPGEGSKPQEGGQKGGGKEDPNQTPPEGNEKERRGEQNAEGKLEAKSNAGQGESGDAKKKRAQQMAQGDNRRDKTTGFSRNEARALLRALTDEDYVRPLADKAVPEGTFKDW
ncbi:MAG: VWA domain-containing protein [Verrucomicrobiales bacterium]